MPIVLKVWVSIGWNWLYS